MQVFDASSIIYAWDNYPIDQFPGLWEWIANQVESQRLVMPSVAFEEVKGKTFNCAEWLKKYNIRLLEIDNTIVQEALHIKKLLGIVGDDYHPKGVGENDLFIIATAKVYGVDLVSNEGRQQLPNIPAKRKIPTVCSMQEVAVHCINFIEYIKGSGVIFR